MPDSTSFYLLNITLNITFHSILPNFIKALTTVFFPYASQDCDQIHIDDVSSDDNGQDLRYGISRLEAAGQVVPSCLEVAGSWSVM